jgi:hypothetical protein
MECSRRSGELVENVKKEAEDIDEGSADRQDKI